jgi:c-di-GMP-binding flagellar brake protein YcgR
MAGPTAKGSDQRRRFGRRLQSELECSLGPVLDISAGGMRILSSRVPRREPFDVMVHDESNPVTLKAKVAWVKKRFLGRPEVGLEFIDVDGETRDKLTRISSSHTVASRKAA